MTTKAMAQQFNEMTYTPEKTAFALFAPAEAKAVKVRIYKDGTGGKALKTVKMNYQDGRWRAEVKGDLMGRFYTFDMGRGESPGVFAKAVGVNGQRAAIIDMAATDPAGWDTDRRPVCKSPADLVIYEMHHRDFSVARAGARHPGKFLALTEPWAIDHLKALDVNAVHILPSYDFGSVDETRLADNKYNWGYDPVNYNVPEGSYSTDPYQPAVRIREFKQMVQALHRAGIRVILDVVYNHTYDIDHSNFQRTYPDYFYRKAPKAPLSSPEGALFSNGSGCGNETASEQPMMRAFMLESVRYWIDEYHIDGFRFDLMGCHDIETMNQIRQMVDTIDPTIFIYGEGWSAGACALPTEQLGVKANIPMMPGIAAFSDELRDALRGPFSGDSKGGFLAGVPDCEESVKFGIAGCISHPQVDMQKVNYSTKPWALQPTQMISYVSCHDDMCLVDRLKASALDHCTIGPLDHCTISPLQNSGTSNSPIVKSSNSKIDSLIRLDLLAQTAVFTSQGVPFMLSGEELLRDKRGVHNSYESPDSINQLDWSNLQRYPQVFDYYSRLIALRRHHPAFRLGSADLVRRHLVFLDTPRQVVAFRLKDYAGRDDWRNIIVILNASCTPQTVDIPAGTYTKVCCDGVINEDGLGTVTGSQVAVSPQSALILHD
ncbi:MAG: type I pullulanase [Prevotella sp.]|nr:type I pullulanase [Prevotella sp.]